jgi:hypothetical protein
MFNNLVMMVDYTLSTAVPIMFYKVVFGEDYSRTKIPCKNFSF